MPQRVTEQVRNAQFGQTRSSRRVTPGLPIVVSAKQISGRGSPMCGIAGWVSYDADLTHRRDVVDAMTGTMACRGPDDEGTWVRTHVALGHRRLAIIDLPGGRQPMTVSTPNGDVAMVYSGETYNFTELKEELTKLGHRWETDSDTEVVLHGYLQWGDAVVDHLNGMYAFAIW